MAIKFQYNKTSLNELGKQLKIRERALPTIKSKESALRLEVKKAKKEAEDNRNRYDNLVAQYDYMIALWGEFDPELLRIKDIELGSSKIAGVRLPHIEDIVFEEKAYNLFSSPIWISDGIELLKKIARNGLEYEINKKKWDILEFARKKTTQKVNLYEKVQIPGYKEAILKIKRFMEDEENLSKSSQKIVKSRHDAQSAEQNAALNSKEV
ncbi:MAG TPA: V-type ATP synthase subunit D [Candidatus Avirikenella pullistercoris]|nr:V-type ATP synthase subunit D [Candidatus Avirikenella pullistercoris]